jgi:mannose-6-phosphate isomerase-like protein (cupin superfamily)
MLASHVHAFEEGFYLLEGEVCMSIEDQAYRLQPGDLGAVKVGQAHAWRNVGDVPARWFQIASPRPGPEVDWPHTSFPNEGTAPKEGRPLDVNEHPEHLLAHFDVDQIPTPGDPDWKAPDAPEGVFIKWMMDENVGAVHHRLLFLEYQPGVSVTAHDHAFEECYFILSGEVEAVLDGKTYRAKPGDVLWTGVCCPHSFANVGNEPVRWLETFAPQPPRENLFRFIADWEKRFKT